MVGEAEGGCSGFGLGWRFGEREGKCELAEAAEMDDTVVIPIGQVYHGPTDDVPGGWWMAQATFLVAGTG